MSFIFVAQRKLNSLLVGYLDKMFTSMQDPEWQSKKVFWCVENQTQLQECAREV